MVNECSPLTPTQAAEAWRALFAESADMQEAERHELGSALALSLARSAACRRATRTVAEQCPMRWPDADCWLALARAKLGAGMSWERLVGTNPELAEFLALHPADTETLARQWKTGVDTADRPDRTTADSQSGQRAKQSAAIAKALKKSVLKRATRHAGAR